MRKSHDYFNRYRGLFNKSANIYRVLLLKNSQKIGIVQNVLTWQGYSTPKSRPNNISNREILEILSLKSRMR